MAIIYLVIIVVYGITVVPIYGHVTLMLYLFDRDVLSILIEMAVMGEDISNATPIINVMIPYLMQGIVIQSMLMTATLPLIFYKILKRIGFYDRIPNLHT